MGGFGSGRPMSLRARRTVRSLPRLDVRTIHRKGFLEPGQRSVYTWRRSKTLHVGVVALGEDRAETLRLVHMKGSEAITEHASLSWTTCNFGGERPWVLCPLCDRRVAHLYLDSRFACRECHDLAYQSSRETDADRALRKAQQIRRQLGGDSDMTKPAPWKPKGMHWRTYWRLREEERQAYAEALVGAVAALGISMGGHPTPVHGDRHDRTVQAST